MHCKAPTNDLETSNEFVYTANTIKFIVGGDSGMNNMVQWLVITSLSLLVGCEQTTEKHYELTYTDKPTDIKTLTYQFAIHPLYNPQKLIQSYQPLIDYLNRHLQGAQLSLEASRDYQAYEQKYQLRNPEILLPNPWQTTQAIQYGYQVIAMAGAPQDFKGVFIARKDAIPESPLALKGKVVSYPSYTALAACVMPQYFLHKNGIDVQKDIQNTYVGSQESSIMNVYLGKSSVAATWPPPWRAFQKDYPKEASELALVWETESLMNNSVMVRDDLPQTIKSQLQTLLTTLSTSTEGRSILAAMETSDFYSADNANYHVVSEYLANFERDVRKIDQP